MVSSIVGSAALILFFVFTAHAMPPGEIHLQIKAGQEAFDAQSKVNVSYIENQATFLEEMSRKFEARLKWDREKERLSMLIYREILASGTDQATLEILGSSKYNGYALSSFQKGLLSLGVEDTLRVTRLILEKGERSRYVFGLFEPETLREIGRRFVRAGFTVSRFNRFFAHLNIYSEQVEAHPSYGFSINERVDSVLEGMIQEARTNPDTEKKIIAAMASNFEKASLKTKKSILLRMSQAQSPSAYVFIKKQFQSLDPEVKREAYSSWSRVRTVEATEDMVRWVKDIEAGLIRPTEDLDLKGYVGSTFYNKAGSDLDRYSFRGRSFTAEDQLVVQKMRQLVFETLKSPVLFLKSNAQVLLKSLAFTDAEVDAHLIEIATDPSPSHRWTATHIVQWRRMTSVNAEMAMSLLLKEPDQETAAAAARNLAAMPKWRTTSRFCRIMF